MCVDPFGQRLRGGLQRGDEFDDALPESFKAPAPKKKDEGPSDEDFFKLIEEDVK